MRNYLCPIKMRGSKFIIKWRITKTNKIWPINWENGQQRPSGLGKPTNSPRILRLGIQRGGSYLMFFKSDSKRLCVDATIEDDTYGRLINHSAVEDKGHEGGKRPSSCVLRESPDWKRRRTSLWLWGSEKGSSGRKSMAAVVIYDLSFVFILWYHNSSW